jgi:hypothetical protein
MQRSNAIEHRVQKGAETVYEPFMVSLFHLYGASGAIELKD